MPGTETINGYTDCQGGPPASTTASTVRATSTNAEGRRASTQSLYTGTTQSINVFYAQLEKKVGLCNVVKTAASMGDDPGGRHVAAECDQASQGTLAAADNMPSFTLGSVGVSPLSMAAAYATRRGPGKYCSPVAIDKIVSDTGQSLAVPSANCHQVLSSDVAEAANYILQGVLTSRYGGHVGGLNSRESAGKTGTSNVENGSDPVRAFAGYTPSLVGYVSVFNPVSPRCATPWADQPAATGWSPAIGLPRRDVRGQRARRRPGT